MLAAAQQRGIVAGIVAFMLVSRLAALLVEGRVLPGTMTVWGLWTVRLGGTAAMALVLPFGVVAIDWLYSRGDRQPLRMSALHVLNGLGIGWVTLLLYGTAMPDADAVAFALFWATGTLVSAAAAGIVGAVRWSRSVVEADAVAAQLLTEESQRTRELIQQRFRPGATVATLRRIGRLLPVDAARAVRLLYRIARHERVLLLRHSAHWRAADTLQSLRRAIALERRDVSFALRGFPDWPATPETERVVAALDAAIDAAEEVSVRVDTVHEGGRVFARLSIAGNGADAFRESFTVGSGPCAVGGEPNRSLLIDLGAAPHTTARARETSEPEHRTFSVVLLMLGYVATCFLVDDQRSSWEATWFFTAASLISVLFWLVAGPLLGRILERKASPRFVLLLAQAALLMLLASGIITIASIGVVAILTKLPVASLFEMPAVSAVVFRRNSILAMVVGATSAAAGISRLLRSRHAMVARLQSEVHQAEAREIEACFHPHFLLNALTSIKALARTNPIEAATMTGHLADLVEKIAGCSGLPYWTVRQEIALVSDYVEIQRMRFKSRLRIETWDVDPAALEERLPRFMLLPLLENVFKHAVSRSAVPVTVGVDLRVRRGALTGSVWNDGAGVRAQHSIGRGLSFVLHRVEEAGGVVKIGAKSDGRFRVRFAI